MLKYFLLCRSDYNDPKGVFQRKVENFPDKTIFHLLVNELYFSWHKRSVSLFLLRQIYSDYISLLCYVISCTSNGVPNIYELIKGMYDTSKL